MVVNRSLSVLVPRDDEAAHTLVLIDRSDGSALLFACDGEAVQLEKEEFEHIAPGYVKRCDVYGVLGVLPVPQSDNVLNYLAVVTQCKSVGTIPGASIYHISAADFLPLFDDSRTVPPTCISSLKKLFATGSFLFAESETLGQETGTMWSKYDLTRRMQNQRSATPDPRFFWNWNMWQSLERQGINCFRWLLYVIRGHVEIRCIYVGGKQFKFAIISRVSRERTGTRFSTRGVDDDGSAANFVETEQAIFSPNGNHVVSVVFTRGSVPIFWEQPGIQVGSHKVRLSRGFEATKPAFAAHVHKLQAQYGRQVFVSLLGRKEGEAMLNSMFLKHVKASELDVPLILFDVHLQCKGQNREKGLEPLLKQLIPHYTDMGFFESINGEEKQRQSGTIRFNCLDCLDRTNFAQCALAKHLLDSMLTALWKTEPRLTGEKCAHFQLACVDAWKKSGNKISHVVARTGALTGQSNAVGKIIDARRSVTRTIKNNFYDAAVQEAIDVLLGKTLEVEQRDEFFLPDPRLQSAFEQKLQIRSSEFVSKRGLNVCVGTWNVNGGKHFRSIAYKDASMGDWLIEPFRPHTVDVYAIGFEEMVDLTAKNMVKTASKNKDEWRQELLEVINSEGTEYGLITVVQLVGVCLYIFVHPKHLDACKDVAVDTVKTGAGGKVGNKGAAAVRMRLYGKSFAFVCAHLAAGQKQVVERNQDYLDIFRKVNFGKGRDIASHDYVFWCGDFNYRIDLPIDDCKEYIVQQNWAALREADQLLWNHARSRCFVGMHEGPLEFAPTYKYDLFSDQWDTSEKHRIPSWTDRVLFRGPDRAPDAQDCKVLFYGRCDTLKMSDHRPVAALIAVELEVVDQETRNAVRDEILEEFRAAHCTVSVYPVNDDLLVEDLRKAFEAFGMVSLVVVEGDTAFISFQDKQAASSSLSLNGTKLKGTQLQVAFTELPSALSRTASSASLEPMGATDSAQAESDSEETDASSDQSPLRRKSWRASGDFSDEGFEVINEAPAEEAAPIRPPRRSMSMGSADRPRRRQFAPSHSVTEAPAAASGSKPSPQRPPPPRGGDSAAVAAPSRPPPPRARSVFQAASLVVKASKPDRPVSLPQRPAPPNKAPPARAPPPGKAPPTRPAVPSTRPALRATTDTSTENNGSQKPPTAKTAADNALLSLLGPSSAVSSSFGVLDDEVDVDADIDADVDAETRPAEDEDLSDVDLSNGPSQSGYATEEEEGEEEAEEEEEEEEAEEGGKEHEDRDQELEVAAGDEAADSLSEAHVPEGEEYEEQPDVGTKDLVQNHDHDDEDDDTPLSPNALSMDDALRLASQAFEDMFPDFDAQ